MIDLIYKIKNSPPTIIGEEAADLFASIITHPDWVVISSAVFGIEETLRYCNGFISSLARIELHGELLLTTQPIHVAFLDKLEDGWDRMWGLIYSNGSVCYSEKNSGEQFLVLFADQSLVDADSIKEFKIDFNNLIPEGQNNDR